MHLQRPELVGTFGMVSSTHWLASAAGMRMLEMGGTAADAACAAGFVLNVVEPHLCGPLGDMPLMLWRKGAAPEVVCGQGPAPAGATVAAYRAAGLGMIPGSGLLASVIPGAFDAWMVTLLRAGRLDLREVMEPALDLAANGHPLLPRAADTIAGMAAFFRDEWPTSHATWLPGGAAPAPWSRFRNPDLAGFWARLLDEAETARGREARIERARDVHAGGFVAEAVGAFAARPAMDGAGARRAGVLTAQDMAGWRATVEPAVAVDHRGWTVWKCGPWTQGPVLLQVLRMLEGDDLSDPEAGTHLVVEALKRAFADREAYYGDPAQSDVPLDMLLSEGFAHARRATIGGESAGQVAPGAIAGCEAWALAAEAAGPDGTADGVGGGEPTMAHLRDRRGDTVHVDVVDRWGTMVSATPSGGWLQSSPVVPGLGVPLNTRAQMFWLDEGRPTTLAPGRRPRTTLSPSLARAPDGTRMAFGTPGGDQQDQWQAIFLLRMIHEGLGMQAAIEAPLFHTAHLRASFHPRGLRSRHLMVEPHLGEAAIRGLRARGHAVEVAEPWTVGRLTAVSERDGIVRAAATPRMAQAYAAGR